LLMMFYALGMAIDFTITVCLLMKHHLKKYVLSYLSGVLIIKQYIRIVHLIDDLIAWTVSWRIFLAECMCIVSRNWCMGAQQTVADMSCPHMH
jgi:hypothetical protein